MLKNKLFSTLAVLAFAGFVTACGAEEETVEEGVVTDVITETETQMEEVEVPVTEVDTAAVVTEVEVETDTVDLP